MAAKVSGVQLNGKSVLGGSDAQKIAMNPQSTLARVSIVGKTLIGSLRTRRRRRRFRLRGA